jgi:putative transposase
MECSHCQSAATTERPDVTAQGYRRFRCRSCGRGFNERTGSLFNRVQYPPDVVCLVVLWRIRYNLSFRDLAEMFLDRGIAFTHEAVRQWEAKLAPRLSETLRTHRRGRIGQSWYCDERYLLKVKGRGVYLYRAIDRDGNLVDVWLSERQDQAAAEAFFRSARMVTDVVPARVTTDGHGAYPGAIKTGLGAGVTHRTNRYLNNHLEQDHRGIKQRTYPMGGFKRFVSAARFCRVYEEVRHFLRARSRRNEAVSLAWQRTVHVGRMRVLVATLALA